jgi:hypothetical protein
MGAMFFWMQNPPGGGAITSQMWADFLDSMALTSMYIVAVATLLIVAGYATMAKNRKIYEPADVFAVYTPMFWLFAALPVALIAGGICWWQYRDALGDNAPSAEAVSLQIALCVGISTLLLAYLIILIPSPLITPSKFRYRPWWLFYRNKGRR